MGTVAADGAAHRATAAPAHPGLAVGAAPAALLLGPVSRWDADRLRVQRQAGRAPRAAPVRAGAKTSAGAAEPAGAILAGLASHPGRPGAGRHAESGCRATHRTEQPLRAVAQASAGSGATGASPAADAGQSRAAIVVAGTGRAADTVDAGTPFAVGIRGADLSRSHPADVRVDLGVYVRSPVRIGRKSVRLRLILLAIARRQTQQQAPTVDGIPPPRVVETRRLAGCPPEARRRQSLPDGVFATHRRSLSPLGPDGEGRHGRAVGGAR